MSHQEIKIEKVQSTVYRFTCPRCNRAIYGSKKSEVEYNAKRHIERDERWARWKKQK